MTKVLQSLDFGKIPVSNFVLESNASMTNEGQITYNSALGKLQYRTSSSTITIDNTGGGGGSLDPTTPVDESGNSGTHTITFDTVKYYTGCSNDITIDLTSAVSYPITQIIEHTSDSPLNILPSEDYVLYGIGDLDYNLDGSTKNIILLYLVDGVTDENGKQIIRVSCAQQPLIPEAENVTISGSAVGVPFTGSYDLVDGTEAQDNTLYQIVKSTTGSDPYTLVASENSYTPVPADDGDYLKFRVKPAILIDNVIHYADRYYESNYIQVSGTLTVEIFQAEDAFVSSTDVDANPVQSNFAGLEGAYYVLLPNVGDTATLEITPSGSVSTCKMEMYVRVGSSVSSTAYMTPMDYIISVNGTTYSEALGNAFSYDSVTGAVATNDFGAGDGYLGFIYKDGIPLNAGTNTIVVQGTGGWIAFDYIRITY